MPILYHDAVGAGLPPLLLHRHTTSSLSFTFRGVEQFVTANGCTKKNKFKWYKICIVKQLTFGRQSKRQKPNDSSTAAAHVYVKNN